MPTPVIVAATRTPIATAFKGALRDVPAEHLATTILAEVVRRSGVPAESVDDVVLAESGYGGGDLARYAAVAAGMPTVPGQAVNRHCAAGLTAVGVAAGQVVAGMARVVVAGGVQSISMNPRMQRRRPEQGDVIDPWIPPTHPETPDAPALDMSITVGWNTAKAMGIAREEMDAWALRSHERAVAAIDSGAFTDEIVGVPLSDLAGNATEFTVDEHPRRTTTAAKLAALPVLHPEIEGFSITAGNSSGVNDAAAAVMVVAEDVAAAHGLEVLATLRAWTSIGVPPRDTGLGAVRVVPAVLERAGLAVDDVALWEINEAFASVPIAVCREHGIDDAAVNVHGSGCSLGHPIAATGARMLTTTIHELRRRGGGIGVAAMCAGGGQAGGVVVEV